jgi:hypothetical protein
MTEVYKSIQKQPQYQLISSPSKELSPSNSLTTETNRSMKLDTCTSLDSNCIDEEKLWSRRRIETTSRCYFQGRLLKRAWALQYSSSISGWTFQIRTYSVRSEGSPIFDALVGGRLGAVQELFGKGLASPNDVDEINQWSLIEVSFFAFDV